MIKAQLFAMGTQRGLLSTQLTYYRTVNAKTGRSGPIPMGGPVTLAFTSENGDDRLLRWITHSSEGELCTLTKAKIVFYEGDLDGSTLFEYQLHDAALVYWKEEFKATGTASMTVTITISAAIQTIKGITWIKPWRESGVLSEEIAAHKEGVQRGISDDRRKEKDGSALEGVVLEGAKAGTHSFNGHTFSKSSSPIAIPDSATVTNQVKTGYTQVKFRWNADGFKYESRWHTRTPGAPSSQGNTWIVTRTTPGNAQGVQKVQHVLTGDNQWTPMNAWQNAVKANQAGTATPAQRQLLQNGHHVAQ